METRGVLWTSEKLTQPQIDEIAVRFEKLLKKKVHLDMHVDAALLGGFIAKIEGKVYDASLRSQLIGMQLDNLPDDEPKSADKEAACDKKNAINDLERQVERFEPQSRVYEYGTVSSSSDGVVFIEGLKGRRYGELLELENGVLGMALELDKDRVGAVLFADGDKVSAGSQACGSGRVVEVPVGDALLGRVVDPLGRPLDGRALHAEQHSRVEKNAPSIIDRQAVNQPMETGLLAIDSMIPIGRGQRELIIGDRQTGKTAIAIDAILNQKNSGVICVYCAIGQKASTVSQIVDTLEKEEAMRYCIVVSATASDSPAMQYISPYSACAMAEYFMNAGRDVLIVYDDLSKHAVAYRTMSLLLHRPPGREAFPGDVFYLHSRLLERSAHLNDKLGGGSMTALPIVETLSGDISAYIPTNIISITDGQIFLETELFNAGIRPAVNVGLSVSRVGRSAQHKAMRDCSGTLRIDLAQYREMAIFAQFSSDIDIATKQLLDRGERLTQMLKQDKKKPLRLSEQVVLLIAFKHGALKNVPVNQVQIFNEKLLKLLLNRCCVEMKRIDQTGEIDDDAKEALRSAVRDYLLQCGEKQKLA